MPIEFYKFANTLDNWMGKNNIDINALANKTNISSAYISNLLNGVRTPSTEKLKILAETLNAPLEEFYQAAGYNIEEIETDNAACSQVSPSDKNTNNQEMADFELPHKRDYALLTLFPMYDLPVEFVPLCEDYRTLSPVKRQAWHNCALTLMNEIKKL